MSRIADSHRLLWVHVRPFRLAMLTVQAAALKSAEGTAANRSNYAGQSVGKVCRVCGYVGYRNGRIWSWASVYVRVVGGSQRAANRTAKCHQDFGEMIIFEAIKVTLGR